MKNTEAIEILSQGFVKFVNTFQSLPNEFKSKFQQLSSMNPEQKLHLVGVYIKPYEFDLGGFLESQMKQFNVKPDEMKEPDKFMMVKYLRAMCECV